MASKVNYGNALLQGFEYLLSNYPEVFVIGQGLWSPWYVGSSMTDLEKKFGKDRVIDTPVSEQACTGTAIGASLAGYKPVVVHPRIDFMLLAVDQIVNQAAKWHHMLGGSASPAVTIRGIINRGGEQGAQHSQALHSWFAHVPGLRVVVPATPADARDLLISSVLCESPVLFIDDRWLYEQEEEIGKVVEVPLEDVDSAIRVEGGDITLVASGYSVLQAMEAAEAMRQDKIAAEVIDLRVLNPVNWEKAVSSVEKTGHLLAIDGGWTNCGMAAEIIAAVSERIDRKTLQAAPARVTLTDSPAPTSGPLEELYYTKTQEIVSRALRMLGAQH